MKNKGLKSIDKMYAKNKLFRPLVPQKYVYSMGS